ncbi:MAG: hypothetical protein WBN75_06440 [Verrucomicrobiia bacterium]
MPRETGAFVPILVAARRLKPPGNPAANGIKFFAASELLELIKDRAWLVKVTNAVNQRWQRNNASKKNGAAEVLANGQASPTAAG